MPITKPFQVTTTIVTTIDPARPDHMQHEVTVDSPTVDMPDTLRLGVAMAACDHTIETLAEHSCVGVMGEIVDEPTPWHERPSPFTIVGAGSYDPSTDVVDVEFTEEVSV